MSDKILNEVGLIANGASLLTAFIAVIFYFKTLKKNYYLNGLPGEYKIFSGFKNDESRTVLNQIKISSISDKGWFFGDLKNSEVFEEKSRRSGGMASVFGKINYSYTRLLIGYLYRIVRFKRFNPLEADDISSFHGKLYLLSRNDLDISKRNWRDMLIVEYSIIHYVDSHRFKLYNPIVKESYLNLPDEIVLLNIDKIPDPLYRVKVSFDD